MSGNSIYHGIMKVPILTYHSCNISGNSYETNDQLALSEDLQRIARKGWQVIKLRSLVESLRGDSNRDFSRCVVLTCDDGYISDVRPMTFPVHGLQPGLLGTLQAFLAESPISFPEMELSSFVIADPITREALDRTGLLNEGWMGEDVWHFAQDSGLMQIECHSWDHNHAVLGSDGPDRMPRGDFFVVDNEIRARYEIDQSLDYLNARLNGGPCRLFAYPYGHVNDYLRTDYLPRNAERLGLIAAVGGKPEPVTRNSDLWNLPRYICGAHWQSPDEFEAILDDCA